MADRDGTWSPPVTVRAVYVEDGELDYRALVFLDESSGEGLEIQRSLTERVDFAPDGAQYCLTLPTGQAHYGGVRSWVVEGRRVRIFLTEDAAAALGLDESLVFDLADRAAATLVQGRLPALLGKPLVTLEDLIAGLSELPANETIFAVPPWGPSSAARSALPAGDGEGPSDGLEYLLEVDLARTVVQVWSEWRHGRVPSVGEACAAVVHYAEHDAYLPVEPGEAHPGGD